MRQVGRFRLRIWQIMLGGAVAVLITGQIGLKEAVAAVNPDVIFFLFGMCVVGEALQQSGYLGSLAHRVFSRADSGKNLLFLIIVIMGIFSAVLMNDTVAIIGTPLVIYFAERFGFPPRILLLALCMAVTTGSAMSPIGNPQNLLIVNYGQMENPFLTFFIGLGVPTLINLILVYLVLFIFYSQEITTSKQQHIGQVTLKNPGLARLAGISLAIIFLMIGVRIISGLGLVSYALPLMFIALSAAIPILIFSPERLSILKNIDWPTLVFFVSMFILMQSVYLSGFLQLFYSPQFMASIPAIIGSSVIISQFISNVPYVALFQPLFSQDAISVQQTLALAAGSTIAGNLTIMGAASNVIVIQNAEKKGFSISFREFFRIGLPLTILQCLVYILFFAITGGM